MAILITILSFWVCVLWVQIKKEIQIKLNIQVVIKNNTTWATFFPAQVLHAYLPPFTGLLPWNSCQVCTSLGYREVLCVNIKLNRAVSISLSFNMKTISTVHSSYIRFSSNFCLCYELLWNSLQYPIHPEKIHLQFCVFIEVDFSVLSLCQTFSAFIPLSISNYFGYR